MCTILRGNREGGYLIRIDLTRGYPSCRVVNPVESLHDATIMDRLVRQGR